MTSAATPRVRGLTALLVLALAPGPAQAALASLSPGTAPNASPPASRATPTSLSPGTAPGASPSTGTPPAPGPNASPTAPTNMSPGTGATTTPPAPTLSPETAPPLPAPASTSERDLAYDLGIQAEAEADHARAATAFERAFRLTSQAESGPRLLFLRASVAARLRADDGSPATRVQLCHARNLLRDYLDDVADPASEEHASLGRVEQRLALASGPDCDDLLGTGVPASPPVPTPVVPQTAPPPRDPGLAQAPRPRDDRRTPPQRALLGSGIAALGIGAAGFAVMGSGVVIGRRAGQGAAEACMSGCTAIDVTSRFRDRGLFGNTLTQIGAVVGGLGVLTGVVLIVVGEQLHRRSRVAVTPRITREFAGLGLTGRF